MFWHPKILSDITLGVGVPLYFDAITISGDFGYYAKILVDIDLVSALIEFVLLDVDVMEHEIEILMRIYCFFALILRMLVTLFLLVGFWVNKRMPFWQSMWLTESIRKFCSKVFKETTSRGFSSVKTEMAVLSPCCGWCVTIF